MNDSSADSAGPKLLSRSEYYSILSKPPEGCLFCQIERQIVLHKRKHWAWIASLSPYFKYHTIFVTMRHITDIQQVSQPEFEDLKIIAAFAEKKYAQAKLQWDDKTPVSLYTYTWRNREHGRDTTHRVNKSTHLHLHMWPERDGLMTSITDPEATTWDPNIFMSNPHRPSSMSNYRAQ
jgi:diadenosine tetraphosphate (Ap4A) HIT family hydrolase